MGIKMKIFMKQKWDDITNHKINGETEVYESLYKLENIDLLFRSLSIQFGKYVNPVYHPGNSFEKIGWVFQKCVNYEMSDEKYIKETEITLHKNYPKIIIEYDYLVF